MIYSTDKIHIFVHKSAQICAFCHFLSDFRMKTNFALFSSHNLWKTVVEKWKTCFF